MDIYTKVLIAVGILCILLLSTIWSGGVNYIDMIILIIVIAGIIYYNTTTQVTSTTNMAYVMSDIDGELYLVRDLPDKQNSANALAKLKKNMIILADYLNMNKDNFPDYKAYIEQLNSKIRQSIVIENGEDDIYTSYSVNKGEQLVFCIRSRRTRDKIHDINLMMYVVLHEMAHVGCPSIGHTEEFKRIFAFFTEQAIKIGLYEKIDFERNPKEYCGMTINESII